MMIEVFQISENSWGYRVGGIYQEFHPEKDGFVPMTEEEARNLALVVQARIQ